MKNLKQIYQQQIANDQKDLFEQLLEEKFQFKPDILLEKNEENLKQEEEWKKQGLKQNQKQQYFATIQQSNQQEQNLIVEKIISPLQNISELKINKQSLFNEILSSIQVQKLRKSMPKNTNVIKHFLKKYIYKCLNKQYEKFFNNSPKIYQQVKKFIQKQKQMYKKGNKNWNNNRQAMIKIFGLDAASVDPQKRSLIMRKIAHQMINKELIPEVLQNHQIKPEMTKCYLYSLITLSYRCLNHQFMSRTQIV